LLGENLAESELFGYALGFYRFLQRGGKPGLLELAKSRAMVFEIGEMSPHLQAVAALLSDGTFAVGGERELKVNVYPRATHRDLEKMVGEGTFRIRSIALNVINLEVLCWRRRL
jgi:transcriptional regulator of aromatic amino acid metabolism